MLDQVVFDTSEICYQLGIKKAVLCPGSRNAPLITSFACHPNFFCYSLIDERSAAYFALGLALQSNEPVVVCCTSGSALLNIASAAAEAFYQEVPIVILSADRPPEWIDQGDGQSMRQNGVLDNHLKGGFQLPVEKNTRNGRWEYFRKIKESVLTSCRVPRGPVHLNIPFREPFYPDPGQDLSFSKIKVFNPNPSYSAHENLLDIYNHKKILLVVGQCHSPLQNLVASAEKKHIPIISEVIANCVTTIKHHDPLLWNKSQWATLSPDLIITVGKALVSKNLKLFLRASNAKHWHLESTGRARDVFQKQVVNLETPLDSFIGFLNTLNNQDPNYFESWKQISDDAESKILNWANSASFSEVKAFYKVVKRIPSKSNVHLANSMPIRYANLMKVTKKLHFYSNRGVSGIDGSNSTAVGISLADPNTRNYLLSGDLSLLYDRNAFLHNHDYHNLKIVVFNNHGGGIFDIIPGPQHIKSQYRKAFIQTTHDRNFKNYAEEFGISYFLADDESSLKKGLDLFFMEKQCTLLEIQTKQFLNTQQFNSFKTIFTN